MPEREGLLQSLYHTLAERIVAVIEPGSRRQTVLSIVQAQNVGERSDEETVHHFRHIPAKVVQRILLEKSKV